MITYGANPVLYTTLTMQQQIEKFISLAKRLQDEEKDREWREPTDKYQFTTEQFRSLFNILGYTQEYSYDSTRVTYYQREWRINYHALVSGHAIGGQNQTPGQGAMHGRLPNGKFAYSMLFDNGDVDCIVVPMAFSGQAQVLANRLGCQLKIYEEEVEN